MSQLSGSGPLSRGGMLSKGGPLSKGGLLANSLGGAVGPYLAPAGFRWEYVTYNGAIVTNDRSPVVYLVRTN